MRAFFAAIGVSAVVAGLAGCSDSTGADSQEPGLPGLTVSAVAASDGQRSMAGTAVPFPLQVRVMRGSAPEAGAAVVWEASAGDLVITSNITNAEGIASAGWVLGNTPGAMTVTAAVEGARGGPVTFRANAIGWVSASVDPTTDGQAAVVGTQLGRPLQVVVSSGAHLEANVTVTWSTTSGTVDPASSLTDEHGIAITTWRLGVVAGPQTATATVARAKGPPLVFHAAATLGSGVTIEKGPGSDNQIIPANFPNFRGLWVSVRDQYGNPDSLTPIIWSVVEGPVTLLAGWTDRSTQVFPTGVTGTARVRAALAGSTIVQTEFTLTVAPPAPLVLVEPGMTVTSFISGMNRTTPAVDTIPAGAAMTWWLTNQDLEAHEISAVGDPSFPALELGYGSPVKSQTFAAPGTYHYVDSYWPGPVGTIVVR